LCAQCRYSKAAREISSADTATSPWWKEPDGVLARVRGCRCRARDYFSEGFVGEARRIVRDSAQIIAGPEAGEFHIDGPRGSTAGTNWVSR